QTLPTTARENTAPRPRSPGPGAHPWPRRSHGKPLSLRASAVGQREPTRKFPPYLAGLTRLKAALPGRIVAHDSGRWGTRMTIVKVWVDVVPPCSLARFLTGQTHTL